MSVKSEGLASGFRELLACFIYFIFSLLLCAGLTQQKQQGHVRRHPPFIDALWPLSICGWRIVETLTRKKARVKPFGITRQLFGCIVFCGLLDVFLSLEAGAIAIPCQRKCLQLVVKPDLISLVCLLCLPLTCFWARLSLEQKFCRCVRSTFCKQAFVSRSVSGYWNLDSDFT